MGRMLGGMEDGGRRWLKVRKANLKCDALVQCESTFLSAASSELSTHGWWLLRAAKRQHGQCYPRTHPPATASHPDHVSCHTLETVTESVNGSV